MEKKLHKMIFTCGGTAGHINPAIALAQLAREKEPTVEILFVGAERGPGKGPGAKGGVSLSDRSHLQLSPLLQAP